MKLKQADFEKMVERKIDFITTDTIFRTWSDEKINAECAGFAELATKRSAFIDFGYYASLEDIERVKQLTLKQGAAEFATNFSVKGEKYGEEALKYSDFISKKNWKGEKTAELLNTLIEFDEKARKAIAFTWPTHAIARAVEGELHKIISEKLKNQIDADHAVAVLTFPTRENTPVVENRRLMKIAAEIAKSPNKPVGLSELPEKIKQKLQVHSEKFGFLGARGAGQKRWNVEDFAARCCEMARDPKLVQKIEKSSAEVKDNKRETEKIMNELSFTVEQRELVEAAKLLVWFRTYRTEVMYHIYSDVESLLEEIGKRFGYSLEEMQYLSTEEILAIEKTKPRKSAVAERQKGFAVVAENGKIMALVGRDREEIEKQFEKNVAANELRGTIACRGKITGRAKIVLTSAELNKVQRGDILVTSMTTPDFVPAMQRAAAFVTNEGGITCHAAIVSREMGKPCLIATKMATKVFKDGELIEVDAELGVVRRVG